MHDFIHIELETPHPGCSSWSLLMAWRTVCLTSCVDLTLGVAAAGVLPGVTVTCVTTVVCESESVNVDYLNSLCARLSHWSQKFSNGGLIIATPPSTGNNHFSCCDIDSNLFYESLTLTELTGRYSFFHSHFVNVASWHFIAFSKEPLLQRLPFAIDIIHSVSDCLLLRVSMKLFALIFTHWKTLQNRLLIIVQAQQQACGDLGFFMIHSLIIMNVYVTRNTSLFNTSFN